MGARLPRFLLFAVGEQILQRQAKRQDKSADEQVGVGGFARWPGSRSGVAVRRKGALVRGNARVAERVSDVHPLRAARLTRARHHH